MTASSRSFRGSIAVLLDQVGISAGPALLGLLTVATWAVWMPNSGGHSPSSWSPVGVFIVLLLGLGLLILRPGAALLPLWRRICLGSLALFVVWNYLSLVWADFPGDAWVGADKSLLYAVSFAVFFLWRWSVRTATTFLALFVLTVAVTSGFWLAQAVASDGSVSFFEDGCPLGPIGYVNGSVALWMTGLWPALFLAAHRRLPGPLRAVFLMCAAFFVQLSVLGQSRAWLAVLPIALALHLLLSRQRLRALLALGIAFGAAALVSRPLLDVFERWEDGAPLAGPVRTAAIWICVSCVTVGLAGVTWAAAERTIQVSPATRRRLTAGIAAGGSALVLVGTVMVARTIGESPISWASERWDSFTCVYCPSEDHGSRFTSTLSNDRYREWTVAWEQFVDSPLIGAGSDNYLSAYLERRTDDLYEPKYPHSTPLRLLGQLGLVGSLLFTVACFTAIGLALRNRRASDPVTGSAVAASVMVFAYWLLHGSVDFLWELPALAAPAFGLLALAASVESGSSGQARDVAPAPARPRSRIRTVALAVAVVGLACAVAAPGLSAAYEQSALRSWRQDPATAYARFDRAASLNPLSASPLLFRGTIAELVGDDRLAEESFRASVRREPRNWYGYLQLALLAASESEFGRATALIDRARQLNPRDRVAAVADRLIRRRIAVDPASVNVLFLRKERARFLQVKQPPASVSPAVPTGTTP